MEGEVLFAITLQTLDAKQVVNLSALDGTSIGQKVQLMKALQTRARLRLAKEAGDLELAELVAQDRCLHRLANDEVRNRFRVFCHLTVHIDEDRRTTT